jgi:hypothetical protein
MNSLSNPVKIAPAIYKTASEFNQSFLQLADIHSIYRILVDNFNYYFFSHLQSIKLHQFDIPVIIAHFHDFMTLAISARPSHGSISSAYLAYYVLYDNSARYLDSNGQHAISYMECHILDSHACTP